MRRIAATLAVVGALLFSAGSAWADWDDGVAAYKRGDYATAYQEFRPLAEQGDAKTQFNLGIMYANGVGVAENDIEAVKWYHKAAEQGYADAQASLGFMFDNGEGVPVNDAQAVKWYRKAAVQGHADAQNNLGVMYSTGEGVPVNNVKAYMWWSLAMKQGYEHVATYLDIIKKQMTSADISKAQALAAEMLKKYINN
jgi:TPR repeat protein